MSFSSNADEMLAALRVTPGWSEMQVAIDDEDVAAILSEAAKVAKDVIAPLNTLGDRVGAQFTDGTVKVPVEYRKAYQALAEGGWIGIEHQPDLGGQGLPLTLFVAVNQLFERACPAFMMALGGTRAAARLLTEWADDQTRSDWVPALLSGEATATICISEPEAGSDVGRIRTNAVHTEDGWYLSGQKIWISFGDHDILSRVGHCVLARTSDRPGTRGLSLFLVPRTERVKTLRIEEKLGLHGSPTCALSFENAHGILLGEEGRGLAQLFTMIRHMRLMVACQGLGTAQSCFDAAREYAQERRQGGNPAEPAVPIIQHADVQLQLADMKTAIDLFRLALVETAVASDMAQTDPVMARRSALFLPLVKNFGAELGFDIAGRAIMVFGGSGFTKDYPVEQALRDSRVFAIYEGTTGMQAQDFVVRQCLGNDGVALNEMLISAKAETIGSPEARQVIDRFANFFNSSVKSAPRDEVLAMAEPVMRAGWVAVQVWMASRIAGSSSAEAFLATALPTLDREIARAHLAARLSATKKE